MKKLFQDKKKLNKRYMLNKIGRSFSFSTTGNYKLVWKSTEQLLIHSICQLLIHE